MGAVLLQGALRRVVLGRNVCCACSFPLRASDFQFWYISVYCEILASAYNALAMYVTYLRVARVFVDA